MSAFSAAVLALSPVGYWRLGESSGTSAVDAAGNQNGVYTNTAGITYSAVGISNDGDTGVVLNGDLTQPYIAIADTAAQHVGDVFTIGMWVRLDYALEANTILFGPGSGTGGPSLGLNSGGTLFTGADGVAFIVASTTAGINDGLKHLVVWTKNGATNHVYFDRGVDVTGSVTNATCTSGHGYRIGSNHGSVGATEYLAGFVDEVFLLPTAATQAQIQALYDLAFVFTAAPTVAASNGVSSASRSAGSTNQAASGGTTYKWRRSGSPIAGQTGTSYSYQSADYGQDLDVLATATSGAGFTTEQAAPKNLSPTILGNTWANNLEPLLSGAKYWEPSCVVDTTNSQYVMFSDPASGPTYNTSGLGRWTCPLASDPTVAANWTFTGSVLAGHIVGSPTVVDQSTQWRIYFYNDGNGLASPLFTATSTDQGQTWSAVTTAIAANAVAWSAGWNGSFAWPTNADPTSANWEMLIGGYIPATSPGEFALAYAKSTDHGATWTPQNGGFYTTPASPTAGCRGGGPWLLNGGQPVNGRYYLLDHISSQVAHQAYPTDIILAYSTDLTKLNGWTLIGQMVDHDPADQYSSLQTADACTVEHGGNIYLFHSGSRANVGGVQDVDQAGAVLAATFPGNLAAFLATPANTVAPTVVGSSPVGSILSVVTGSWTGNPTSFTYQWLRDGSPILGAVNPTYKTVLADATHAVSVQLAPMNVIGTGTAATSSNGVNVSLPPLPSSGVSYPHWNDDWQP